MKHPTPIVLELSPYGFPIRIEIADGRARVWTRRASTWEPTTDARMRTPLPARTRPEPEPIASVLHRWMVDFYREGHTFASATRELARIARDRGAPDDGAAQAAAAQAMQRWPGVRAA